MCFTSLIVPVTIFGSIAIARRMDAGNAAPSAAVPMARRIVRRSTLGIGVPERLKGARMIRRFRYNFLTEQLMTRDAGELAARARWALPRQEVPEPHAAARRAACHAELVAAREREQQEPSVLERDDHGRVQLGIGLIGLA